jgi:hypothetical protein
MGIEAAMTDESIGDALGPAEMSEELSRKAAELSRDV